MENQLQSFVNIQAIYTSSAFLNPIDFIDVEEGSVCSVIEKYDSKKFLTSKSNPLIQQKGQTLSRFMSY